MQYDFAPMKYVYSVSVLRPIYCFIFICYWCCLLFVYLLCCVLLLFQILLLLLRGLLSTYFFIIIKLSQLLLPEGGGITIRCDNDDGFLYSPPLAAGTLHCNRLVCFLKSNSSGGEDAQ